MIACATLGEGKLRHKILLSKLISTRFLDNQQTASRAGKKTSKATVQVDQKRTDAIAFENLAEATSEARDRCM